MRQINFLIIFVISLALVLFSLENTEPAVIHVVQGMQVQAPLAVELILAMGVGAVLAWVFSVWTQLQRLVELQKEIRQSQQKDERIQTLEQDVERYKAEIQEQRRLPAAADSRTEEVEAELYAQ